MRNYIILNDQNSNDISGLLIQSLAPISKPLMRTEIEEIDGRDGDITTKLGYSAYDKQITIGLFGNYDVDQVIAFFNSEGTAIFSNEPDKYYNYQIVDQIDFERLVRYKTATVTMHCQPFKYSTTEGADILSSSANFATLNQSLNTDSSFYTYSSNVQADITATRQSGTGGKFFAVFTVPVVQGVTYHFSGNVSRNVSMYGYTDQLRGTSAGIAGKGFSGNFVYTATFTGTMVLGFYSNATTEIFIRSFAISNEAGTTISDEGTNLVLEGTGEAPFSQFDLKGNTEQNGTPTPDAPVAVQTVTGENVVKICGKNLQDSSSFSNYYIDNSGNLVADGALNGLFGYTPVKPSTQYTLSASEYTKMSVAFYNGTTFISRDANHDGSSHTFTTPNNCTAVRCWFYHAEGVNQAYLDKLKIQLETGSQRTEFEPYQGQSYEVDFTGKNKLNTSAGFKYGYINDSGQYSDNNTNVLFDGYIPVKPNTDYTFSSNHSNSNMTMVFYTENKTFISRSLKRGTKVNTSTTPSNCSYVRLQCNYDDQDMTNVDIDSLELQFEKGASATDYEAYQAIELCKIGNYQDYIWNDNGTWKVHKAISKLVFTGAESEIWFSTQTSCMDILVSGVVRGSASNNPILSNMYVQRFAVSNGSIFISGGADWICVVDATNATSVEAWKTFLGSNNLTVYYAIKTPTDTTITNEALIAQLDDIYYHAHAYKERTHISSTYAEGNVPHIIAAAVTGDADGTVTNSGNIYSKPKLTIFGTGDIGVYLNGVQMFQIALGTSGYITIDTALMEAYQDNLQTLMNRQVTGDYSNFVLNPGENTISFTGSVSMCVVENYSRWL